MIPIEPPTEVTEHEFARWRAARRGRRQAEVMTNPYWTWMIETGYGPYLVNEHFDGPPSRTAGPAWTNQRYGQTTTLLSDSRTVLIGGEHEDYYDPDFYIYNDVILRLPTGAVEILGYDDTAFPPTDFHTATVVDDTIVLIGNVGYSDRRQVGHTQVLILDTLTWHIRAVETSGDNPGWLAHHVATLVEPGSLRVSGGKVQIGEASGTFVENTDDWILDLDSWTWHRATNRGWQQWQIARDDGGPSALWRHRTDRLISPDLAMADGPNLDDLYVPPIPHAAHDAISGEFNIHRIDIDTTTIRYVEDMGGVRMVVEGPVADSVIARLVDDLTTKLTELDDHRYSPTRLA